MKTKKPFPAPVLPAPRKEIPLSPPVTFKLKQLETAIRVAAAERRIMLQTILDNFGAVGQYDLSPDSTKLVPIEPKEETK